MKNNMIKDTLLFDNFNKEYLKKNRMSYLEKLKILEGLWQEAVALKVLPGKNKLEGIESDIRIAAILNSKRENKNV